MARWLFVPPDVIDLDRVVRFEVVGGEESSHSSVVAYLDTPSMLTFAPQFPNPETALGWLLSTLEAYGAEIPTFGAAEAPPEDVPPVHRPEDEPENGETEGPEHHPTGAGDGAGEQTETATETVNT